MGRKKRQSKSKRLEKPEPKSPTDKPERSVTLSEGMNGKVDKLRGFDWKTRRTVTMTLDMPLIRAFLLRNINNRPLSKRNYEQYRDIILRDEWQVTNDGVAFLKDGSLADGQHRLVGGLVANKPITIEVTFGLTEAERDAKDLGRKRTVSDIAAIRRQTRGESVRVHKTASAAVARVSLKGISQSTDKSLIRSSNNVVKWLEKHDDLITDYVGGSNYTTVRRRYHSGWVGAFVMAAILHGRDVIDPMIKKVWEQDYSSDVDPLAAFDRVISSARANGIRRAKVHYGYAVSAITAALKNHSRQTIKGSTTDFQGALKVREEFLSGVQ